MTGFKKRLKDSTKLTPRDWLMTAIGWFIGGLW